MNKTYNSSLVPNSQKLRKEMTKEERRLWYTFLKELPVTINRQKVIGKYIVDFYCAKAKVIIELDGSQHYETEGKYKDEIRDEYFRSLGLTVLRYSNYDVNTSFRGVCEDIYNHIFDTSSVRLASKPATFFLRKRQTLCHFVTSPLLREYLKGKARRPIISLIKITT